MLRSTSWFQATVFLALICFALLGLARSDCAAADDDSKPIRALLVIGGGFHDYAKQKDLLARGISARANVQWKIAYDPDKASGHLNSVFEKADWARGFDVVVHDDCTSAVKDLDLINRILEPHRNGLPAVVLHCAMHSFRSEGWPKVLTPWFEFTGLQTTAHGPQAPIAVSYIDRASAITKGLQDWTTINEELYNNIAGKVLDSAQPLARGKQTYKKKDGKEQTDDCVVAWTNNYRKKARVFATTLGHNNDTVGDGRYLDLVARGLLWSVNQLDAAHLKPAKQVLLDESGRSK